MTVLGPRGYYAYTSDTGKVYSLLMRSADADAVGNTPVQRADHPYKPAFLKPRHVWGTAGPGIRRKFTIGSQGNAFYQGGGTIAVDGGYSVTGRVGEKDIGGTVD